MVSNSQPRLPGRPVYGMCAHVAPGDTSFLDGNSMQDKFQNNVQNKTQNKIHGVSSKGRLWESLADKSSQLVSRCFRIGTHYHEELVLNRKCSPFWSSFSAAANDCILGPKLRCTTPLQKYGCLPLALVFRREKNVKSLFIPNTVLDWFDVILLNICSG